MRAANMLLAAAVATCELSNFPVGTGPDTAVFAPGVFTSDFLFKTIAIKNPRKGRPHR